MSNFKRIYRDLETQVFSTLRDLINDSKIESDFVQEKALKIELDDFYEICIIHDRLVLIDINGGQFNTESYENLEGLIDLIDTLKHY